MAHTVCWTHWSAIDLLIVQQNPLNCMFLIYHLTGGHVLLDQRRGRERERERAHYLAVDNISNCSKIISHTYMYIG